MIERLWFAFEFVSLTYQTHPLIASSYIFPSCDLLLNLYLWHIKHTFDDILNIAEIVVICFWICIFDISNTPHLDKEKAQLQLWFAFEFLSLTYQTHPTGASSSNYMRLWFAFEFVSLTYQTHRTCWDCSLSRSCDLLLNLYLWHIKHTRFSFVPSPYQLWFAFEFVSLTYQTHQ